MARERERSALERAEAERQAAQALAANIAAEKQRLERQLAKQREAERLQQLSHERLAEHAARLHAIHEAELARARLESEARAESDLEAQRMAHERRLSELKASAVRTRDRAIAFTSSIGLALLGLGAPLLHFAHFKPQAERTERELAALATTERTRADTAARLLAAAESRAERLTRDLESLRQREPAPSAPKLESAPARRPPERPSEPKPRPSKPCKNDGDPLNPCLH